MDNDFIDTEHGRFSARYDYENYDEEIGLIMIKTAEEVYQEWLANRDKPIEEPSKMEVLEEEVSGLRQENKLLKAQVEALSQTSDFHEELIVEMANKVYA